MNIVPSLVELEALHEALRRGIEDQVVVFSSEVRKRALIDRWNAVVARTEPVLILGTPPTLSLPVHTLDTLVIERESARSYRGRDNPHIDFRRAAEYVARHSGARLILGDFPNRVETRARVEEHAADDLARPQVRPGGRARVQIIDNRPNDTIKRERRSFKPLADATIAAIQSAVHTGERAVVFAARRGIAPLTVCNDCGTPISDPATGTPMVLHKTPAGNMFISHRSGALLPANTVCSVCGGWNLVTLGIGVDRVYDELKKVLPKTPLFLLTAETAKTHQAANKVRKAFYDTPGAILVGTERMLPYLTEPVAVTAVASIDSLLSLSAWRAHEHALSILMHLRERSTDTAIIETRRPETEVMKAVASGNPMDFYRAEIAERRAYGYPPFATFIGLSWYVPERTAATLRALVTQTFARTDLVGPLPPEVGERGRVLERAVIRVPEGAWPQQKLAEQLRALPHEILVTIDPDEIV
jgi:primosomal protein N' (replication factor Y) (superfamily II helicase)